MTVLLADDDDGLRNNFARFIRQFFPVITAGTVDETRAALRARDDWRGFVFDLRFGPNQPEAGFTLLAEARALFPDVPAFIVTGFLDAETVLRAASLDARCWPKAMATEHFRQLANILEREKKTAVHRQRDARHDTAATGSGGASCAPRSQPGAQVEVEPRATRTLSRGHGGRPDALRVS
jgi:DNA-binding NtrC family response regulator